MDSPTEQRIEVVRGRIDAGLAERLVGFWTGHGALSEPEARERLAEVVCVLRDPRGEIVGVNSAHPAEAPLVGRPFWIYRRFLAPADREAEAAMIRAAKAELEREFTSAPGEPMGLCALISDRKVIEANPEALWKDSGLLYAGYTPAGAQVRIGYFEAARVSPGGVESRGEPPSERYRILPFAEAEGVSEETVLEFWSRHQALPAESGRRRVAEVASVALDETDRLAAVSTVFLKHSPRLRMDLWRFRVFVAPEHRQASLANTSLNHVKQSLEQRFVSGVDTRAPGIMVVTENEILKRAGKNQGIRPHTRIAFIGENDQGDHIRVYYFPGARAPLAG